MQAGNGSCQEELEEKLNLILLQIADLQDGIWNGMERLQEQGRLSPPLEEHIRQVMGEVSLWVDQCCLASESTPVLLRRMEVHLARLVRIDELIEKMSKAAESRC